MAIDPRLPHTFKGVVAPICASLLLVACGSGSSNPQKPSASISAAPTSVASGGTSTLSWSSTGATSCTASGGWTGTKATSGTQSTGALTASTSYSLTCSGASGASPVATATVTVAGSATVTLAVAPTSVASGGASTLTWSSTDATSCTASGGWSGTKTPSGTQSTGALTVPTTYSLICTGTGGASKVSSVTVNVVPLATITANPSVVMGGVAFTLTWSSANATSCTGTTTAAGGGGWSGTKATSGTQPLGPITATTSYSITCAGAGGTSSVATATVTISDGTVVVSPKTAALTLSGTQLFTAIVPAGGGVNWSVDGVDGGTAAVGTISPAGLYTAGTAAGAHTVLATSMLDPSHSGSAAAAVTDLAGVYTYHNDLARDGVNSREYALTTANVNTASFGKLFACAADGAIYAQPLWAANLTVNGVKHNVVFVATQHDSVYAFDADAGPPCVTLWSGSMLAASHGASTGETTVPTGATDNFVGAKFGSVAPEIGITGTPVIDPATNTLYVVSKSVNAAKTNYYQRLHAIDATTGNEKPGSPVLVSATYPGSGDGGTTVTFTPRYHHLRSGIALVNGVVYLAWTGHEDAPPYYGWIMGYDGKTLTQLSVLNVTPNVHQGGIWMSGSALAADSNNLLYALTANGGFDVTNSSGPKNDYGDSLLQLTPSLTVNQYFTPSDQSTDNTTDTDFGSGGAAILADLPAGSAHPHLVMGGGKDGVMYVIDRDTPGGLGDGAAVQHFRIGPPTEGNFATGAFWSNHFYIAASNSPSVPLVPLASYSLDTSSVLFTPSSSSAAVYGFPGATPSVSAPGTHGGIVWAVEASKNCLQGAQCGPAVLHAYDAINLTPELWNSSMVPSDAAGNAVKFAVPTIANGRVYVGTRGNSTGVAPASGELDVYGLKP